MANSYGNYNDFVSNIVRSPGNLTPRIINTFFLLALESYFISHPEYQWDQDPNKTSIDIHPAYEEDDNIEKGMPVIVLQDGQVGINSAGIGTGLYNMESRITHRGNKVMTQKAIQDSQLQFNIDSSIIINVLGMSPDDTEELAFEIGMFLLMVKYDAAKILQVQNLGTVQISPPQAVEKKGWANRYLSQISLPYTFTLTRVWKPVDSGELLRSIPTVVETKVSGISHEGEDNFVPRTKILQPGDTDIPEDES